MYAQYCLLQGETVTARLERKNRNARYFHPPSSLQTTKVRCPDFTKKSGTRVCEVTTRSARVRTDRECGQKNQRSTCTRNAPFALWTRVDTDCVFWMPFRCCWGAFTQNVCKNLKYTPIYHLSCYEGMQSAVHVPVCACHSIRCVTLPLVEAR